MAVNRPLIVFVAIRVRSVRTETSLGHQHKERNFNIVTIGRISYKILYLAGFFFNNGRGMIYENRSCCYVAHPKTGWHCRNKGEYVEKIRYLHVSAGRFKHYYQLQDFCVRHASVAIAQPLLNIIMEFQLISSWCPWHFFLHVLYIISVLQLWVSRSLSTDCIVRAKRIISCPNLDYC